MGCGGARRAEPSGNPSDAGRPRGMRESRKAAGWAHLLHCTAPPRRARHGTAPARSAPATRGHPAGPRPARGAARGKKRGWGKRRENNLKKEKARNPYFPSPLSSGHALQPTATAPPRARGDNTASPALLLQTLIAIRVSISSSWFIKIVKIQTFSIKKKTGYDVDSAQVCFCHHLLQNMQMVCTLDYIAQHEKL